MTEHLAEYSVINNIEHGFTKCRSCLTNLLECSEEVYEKLDEGRCGIPGLHIFICKWL